ncbi:hypothetical protein EVAR_65552_1 [Eumeta japonica]|uniref:Histone-lysine N-methyltransferase SETMAR n=1 Tax=Eumeta variegata TaxID=151549 RepID=A0A4C1ZDC9_EUMVA|nr:hypothetical protein EVAR_65552_1 [Eumeta japonica]
MQSATGSLRGPFKRVRSRRVNALTRARSGAANAKSGNYDLKDESRSGRPVTDEVDTILERVEEDRHISSYNMNEELGIDHETVLTHL